MPTGTEQEIPGRDSAAEGRTNGPDRWTAAFTRVVLAAHVPFVCLHFGNLYHFRPYYRFFPLWLAAVAWLMWKRWPRAEVQRDRRSPQLLLLSGLGCLAASVWLLSPSLGATAAVLSLAAILVHLKGRAAIRNLTGAWLMLWLMAPPTVSAGDWLVRGLLTQAARTSSWILESLNVDHFLAGNVFQLAQCHVYVAEACSGVQSPLILVFVSILTTVLLRRSLLHGLLLAVAAVFWTFVLHTARVVIVVLATAQSNSDLPLSGQHDVLGYSLVVLGLLLWWSTDRWLVGFLAPVLIAWSAETNEDPLSQFWNRMISRSHTMPTEQEPLGRRRPIARSWKEFLRAVRLGCVDALKRFWRSLITPDEKLRSPEDPAAMVLPLQVEFDSKAARWTVLFGCVGTMQLILVLAFQTPHVSALARADAFQESWLPRRFGDWQATEYQSVHRANCSDDGRFGRRWGYQSGDRVASVSVDFPFLGWHELTGSYEVRGWTEVARTVGQADTGPFVAVQLSAPDGESGYLLYSLFDGAARPVPPGTASFSATQQQLAHPPLLGLFGRQGSAVWLPRGTVQIQQLITHRYPLSEPQRRGADRLYLEFRRRLLEHWRAHLGVSD